MKALISLILAIVLIWFVAGVLSHYYLWAWALTALVLHQLFKLWVRHEERRIGWRK